MAERKWSWERICIFVAVWSDTIHGERIQSLTVIKKHRGKHGQNGL